MIYFDSSVTAVSRFMNLSRPCSHPRHTKQTFQMQTQSRHLESGRGVTSS